MDACYALRCHLRFQLFVVASHKARERHNTIFDRNGDVCCFDGGVPLKFFLDVPFDLVIIAHGQPLRTQVH